MTEEIQKHREEKKRSEKLFAAVDRSREHFIEATKKVTEAEKHIEKEEKKQIDIDESLQQTEKEMTKTEKEVIETHRKIKGTEGAEAEQKPEKKAPPPDRLSR